MYGLTVVEGYHICGKITLEGYLGGGRGQQHFSNSTLV